MTTQARELAGLMTNAGDLHFADDIHLLSDGGVLNFGADNDVTLTHVADTGLLLNSSRRLQFGDSGTYINQSADGVLNLTSDTEVEINATTVDINANVDISGNLVLGGNITIGDADSDSLTLNADLTSHLIPNATNTYDLGTSSKEWRNAYFDGTVTSDAFAGPLTGDVTGNVSGTAATVTGAAQSAITSLGTLTTLTVDDITINGSTISDAGTLTVDIGGTLILDADDGDVQLKDDGTQFASLYKSSNDFIVRSMIADGDFKIQVNDSDGGGTINAITLDASEKGKIITSAGGIQIGTSVGTGYGITSDIDTQYGAVIKTTESSPSAAANLWSQIDDDGTVATLFRVQNNGLVSIGNTDSPQRRLHLIGPDGTTSLTEGNSRTALFLDNAGATYINLASSNTGDGGIFFSDADANNRGGIRYAHNGDEMYWTVAASEAMRFKSGRLGINHSDPEHDLHVVTTGSSNEDGILKVGGSGASLGLELRYDQAGNTVSQIIANPTYTNNSSLLHICVDGDANPNQLVLDGAGRIGVGAAASSGTGRMAVYGLIAHGGVQDDPDVTESFTGFTQVNGSTLVLVSSTARTLDSSGDTLTISWNKGSWASIMYDIKYSGASFTFHQTGGCYHNNTGASWSGHAANEHINNTGVSNPVAYGGSGQTMTWTITFPGGYHPSVRFEVSGGGGMGRIMPNEFTFTWNG